MTNRVRAFVLVLVAPLMLMSCVLTPGKFVSTLDIRADRSFTFTYKGEVIGVDFAKEFAKGMAGAGKSGGDGSDDGNGSSDDSGADDSVPSSLLTPAAFQNDSAGMDDAGSADSDAKFQAIAAALSKEAGYRSVVYKGKGVFEIDYAISGKLTHNFLYPYNLDAEVIFPFVVIELRGASNVRVKAPGFAKSDNDGGMGAMGGGDQAKAASQMDGTFTLTTNAEIVSQNNEDGAKAGPAGSKQIQWRATPLSKDAPTAVLKLLPLAG